MKIVILAAGLGSRLNKGETDRPKPLTMLSSGKSIMQNQIDNLAKYFSVDDILVVVGYKMTWIMEEFSDLSYVYNQDFSSTNTSKSLLKALKKIKGESVLWLNGDVVFDAELLSELFPLIAQNKTFVSVNNSKVSDEEVKYILDSNGDIKELSKIVENGLGEAVGINYVSSNDLDDFKKALEDCDDNDYFEKGIEKIIEKGTKIHPLDISKYFCMEVDFKEDLQEVNQKFQTYI